MEFHSLFRTVFQRVISFLVKLFFLYYYRVKRTDGLYVSQLSRSNRLFLNYYYLSRTKSSLQHINEVIQPMKSSYLHTGKLFIFIPQLRAAEPRFYHNELMMHQGNLNTSALLLSKISFILQTLHIPSISFKLQIKYLQKVFYVWFNVHRGLHTAVCVSN